MSRYSRSAAKGMSLIELMIAMVIGLVLMLGVVQVFSASRTAYQLSEGVARTQESSRFAMDFLQRDLRMAGHFGCINDQAHLQSPGGLTNHYGAAPAFPLDFATSIQAYDANGTTPGATVTLGAAAAGWAPALPADIAALNPLPGSDVVVLRFLANEGVPVTGVTPAGAATTFNVDTTRWNTFLLDGVATPQMFGIADCSFVDVFGASGTNPGAGVINTANLVDRYTAQPSGQTVMYRAESLVYYVARGAGGEPSLWRARYNGAAYVPEELVEGVESMQLMFGMDRSDLSASSPSGYIDTYGVASAVQGATNGWRRVGSVQVGLLMRSPDRAAARAPEAANNASALGVTFLPPAEFDGRHRAAYESTVALRNRLYGN